MRQLPYYCFLFFTILMTAETIAIPATTKKAIVTIVSISGAPFPVKCHVHYIKKGTGASMPFMQKECKYVF